LQKSFCQIQFKLTVEEKIAMQKKSVKFKAKTAKRYGLKIIIIPGL